MKLLLSVALVWTLLSASMSYVILDETLSVANNVVNDTTGTVVIVENDKNAIVVVGVVGGTAAEVASNAAHLACIIFGNTIQSHPLQQPQIERISFILRTPCGSKEFPVSEAAQFLLGPEFDANKTTVVLITGWGSDPDAPYIDDMAKAYHCRGGYNFIVVNTGGYLTNLYVRSAYVTTKLGEFAAVGLVNLGIPAENIHLIGHSLGAHVVGSCGRHYFALTGSKVARITGLDPARPCFIEPIVFPRLGRGDADIVDVVHSNPKDLGTEEVIGDSDFFPGGLDVIKPGCTGLSLSCSHLICIQYYVESVYPNNENNFMAVHCASYSDLERKRCVGSTTPMGYAADASANGIYYLTVRAQSLYGMNATASSTLPSGECGRCLI